jgi:hypothetical protein
MRIARGFMALFALICLALAAAGISGKWKGQMESGREVVFDLKTDGAKVSGTMSDAEGKPRPITAGELTGDEISLTIASEWQGQPVKLLAKGKIQGEQMNITLSSEGGEWSTEVTLKRVAE